MEHLRSLSTVLSSPADNSRAIPPPLTRIIPPLLCRRPWWCQQLQRVAQKLFPFLKNRNYKGCCRVIIGGSCWGSLTFWCLPGFGFWLVYRRSFPDIFSKFPKHGCLRCCSSLHLWYLYIIIQWLNIIFTN